MATRPCRMLAALLCLLILTTTARAAESYITTSGAAARAMGVLVEKIGKTPRLLSVRISEQQINVQAEGGKRPSDVDEWRVGHVKRFFLDFETTGGPFPVTSPGLVSDVASGFFALDEIALEKTAEIAAAAIAYARLEDTGTVQSIEIQRQVSILPAPRYGEVRWSLYVTSGRESATVRFDGKGNIVGADLSNTNRARTMNLITADDWPKAEALADLKSVIGTEARLRDFTVYPRSLSLKVDHQTLPGQIQGYGWTVSGVTRDPILSPLFPGRSDAERFSLDDVDLAPLATIRDNAIKAWANANSTLNYMMLKRSLDDPKGPELRWVVNFNDIGANDGSFAMFGASGSIELSTSGEVKVVKLPAYRQKKRDWLAPETAAEVLGRLDTTFGPGARFAEITIRNEQASVLAEDPDTSGRLLSYLVDDQELRRTGNLMPWNAAAGPERLFDTASLKAFSGQKMAELKARTYATLKVSEAEMPVARYTFSIGQLLAPDGTFMVPSPDGKVTLEIRVEGKDGWKGGRVTYSSTGDTIDVVTP